jgi:hypothetical protein
MAVGSNEDVCLYSVYTLPSSCNEKLLFLELGIDLWNSFMRRWLLSFSLVAYYNRVFYPTPFLVITTKQSPAI